MSVGASAWRGSPGSTGRYQDAQTVDGFLRGDPASVATIDASIHRAAARFRRRLGPDWEDVLQEVRLKAVQSLHHGRYRGQACLETYLWQVASHACIDGLRRRWRRPTVDLDSVAADLVARGPSPFDVVAEHARVETLLAAVASLPTRCRELWRLILAGASYREMSDRLGVSVGALRVRVFRCRKTALRVLRRAMAPTSPGS